MMNEIPDKECVFNLSSASARSETTSRDDGYFSRTGESMLEDQGARQEPKNLSQVSFETFQNLSKHFFLVYFVIVNR